VFLLSGTLVRKNLSFKKDYLHDSQSRKTEKYGYESLRSRKQVWMCWRGPVAVYPTRQTDRPMAFFSYSNVHSNQYEWMYCTMLGHWWDANMYVARFTEDTIRFVTLIYLRLYQSSLQSLFTMSPDPPLSCLGAVLGSLLSWMLAANWLADCY
jgi:hypothetical protein